MFLFCEDAALESCSSSLALINTISLTDLPRPLLKPFMVSVALLISFTYGFPLSKDFVNYLRTVKYWNLVLCSTAKSGTLTKSIVPNSEVNLFLLSHSMQTVRFYSSSPK